MSNHPMHDAALALASTVGTNVRTLRKNKRDLGRNLVLAATVEGFAWANLWADAKKAAKFATMDKPEQNQFNVFGTALKTIILAWPTLDDATKRDFTKGDIIFSTLATTIKDAEKAADKAEADKAATEAAGEEASQQPDPRDEPAPTPAPVEVQDRSAMIDMVAALFEVDADAATFTDAEMQAMIRLVGAVDAFKAATLKQAQAA